jgi:hypothetical protein
METKCGPIFTKGGHKERFSALYQPDASTPLFYQIINVLALLASFTKHHIFT